MKNIAIYPGTFDPITVGHMDILRRSLAVADHLIVGVARAHHKNPLFSHEERVKLVEQEVVAAGLSKQVSVLGFEGLLVDFAEAQDAKVIVRGLRAVSDFEYEFQLASMNARLNKNVQTVFLTASENCQFVASNLVKEVSRLKGDVSSFVSANVAEALLKKFHG